MLAGGERDHLHQSTVVVRHGDVPAAQRPELDVLGNRVQGLDGLHLVLWERSSGYLTKEIDLLRAYPERDRMPR